MGKKEDYCFAQMFHVSIETTPTRLTLVSFDGCNKHHKGPSQEYDVHQVQSSHDSNDIRDGSIFSSPIIFMTGGIKSAPPIKINAVYLRRVLQHSSRKKHVLSNQFGEKYNKVERKHAIKMEEETEHNGTKGCFLINVTVLVSFYSLNKTDSPKAV